MTWVGRSIRRLEDPALVRGDGRFTGDLTASRWVRFVRSPVAAGRIARISVPAGSAVFTSVELAAVKPIRPLLHKFNYIPVSQPVLAKDVVRFVGEPIAAVVASTQEDAEDLADLVGAEIEPTPAVVGAREARGAGAACVHAEAPDNVIVDASSKTAGFDAALAGAHRRIAFAARSHRQNALPIEPRAAHAAWDRSTGRVTLTCSTQAPHAMRTVIAELIGMAESDLRVIAPDVGGGFGQKMSLSPEFVVITWLARALRTSVAWIEDRRENLIACFHSRDQHIAVEGGFDADGRLTALSADILANVGAYSCYPTTCGVEPLMAMAEMPGPYDVPEYACVSRAVLTHTCPMAPYRGVSRPVITFAIERLMDKAAAAFGLDPGEIRRRNLIRSFPHTSVTGLLLDQASYIETMDAAVQAIDVAGFRARQAQARAQGRYLGLGLATFCERTGYGTPAFAARGMEVTPGWETVEMTVDPSGSIEARIGASPHGQGLRTTLAQIIADELGTSPDRIKIVHGDTDRTPYGWGTFASRSLVIAGGATLMAARKVRARLTTMAGILLEAAAEDIVLEADAARVVGTDRSIRIESLARAAYHQVHRFKGEIGPGIMESATYDPAGTFSNACHVAVVEVDVETG
ncbi:MAG TPA: xanthine dehydrogenase family protein molybdopterin-binding subunit, partial [Xanthobacteraceae bacterium]